MKKGQTGVVIVGVVILVVIIGLFFAFSNSNNNSENSQESQGTVTLVDSNTEQEQPPQPTSSNTILMTSSGFNPKSLTIQQGETVTWINQNTVPMWPASAMHPTHKVYPNSGIEKCGTSESSQIFDACRGISPGEPYSFTFNEVGSWNYHDHLNPSLWGTITVQ